MPSRARLVAQPNIQPIKGNSAVPKAADVEQKWRLLDQMLSSSADFAYAFDREGRFLYVNQPLLNLWGLTLEEAVGKNFFDLKYSDELATRLQRQIQEVFATGEQIADETQYTSPTGASGYFEYIFSGVVGSGGTVELVAGASRDITVRKAAEKHLEQMEGRYRGLLEAAPDAMVVVNQRGEIVLLNAQAENQFGYRRDELLGQRVTNIIPEGFAERLIADGTRTAAEALAQQIGTGIELYGRRKNGTEFPIEIMLSPLESAEGTLVTAAIRNISVRKAAERHLEHMEGRYRGLLEAAPDAMVVVNQGGEIVLLNAQAEKQFGYRRDELLGQKVKRLIPEGFAERLLADGTRTATESLAQQIGTGIELNGRRKDGSEFPIEIMLSPLESPEGILVTAAIRNITVRKEVEKHLAQMTEQIAHSAEHDSLTGLPNRLLLNDRLGQAIALAQRHRGQVAVLFLDLDGFKHINDSLGHRVGDKLLQSVATRLLQCFRAPDTVSRQGGDEFIVLLQDVNKPEDAAVAATRVLKEVAEAHSIDQHDLHVTASIGVSLYPDDGSDPETLIKNADTAMYQAKESGRQSCKFFRPEMNVRAVDRQSIEEDLRRALDRNEFRLHYQPKINLKTGAITGAEALIRWTHPTRGSVPPDKFIPVAEDSYLIQPIGAWVLREACMQARAWADAGLPFLSVAVNVSAIQFRSEGFLEGLLAILSESLLDPRALELEVTERVLMKDPERTTPVFQTLKDIGIHVAVDDFGTGYSNLSYLRKIPLDALKIDQSFVRQIASAGGDTSIVSAIISMGRSLNLKVIAEGIETSEELAFLKAQECDEGQGYYFSRPVPAEEFARLLLVAP
jgi:diguanylate cyclase (GGDEF)-like protein/PAS domain S-box-containing protein